jgi:chromosome segregation ATPase
MSDTIVIRKSTIKKITAIACIIVLSTVGYFIYEQVIVDRITLSSDISNLQMQLTSKVAEVNNLNNQIDDLESQIVSLQAIINQKTSEIADLTNQTNTKNEQLRIAWDQLRGAQVQMEELMKQIEYLKATPAPTKIFVP